MELPLVDPRDPNYNSYRHEAVVKISILISLIPLGKIQISKFKIQISKKIQGSKGGPEKFISLESYHFCELGAHAKF